MDTRLRRGDTCACRDKLMRDDTCACRDMLMRRDEIRNLVAKKELKMRSLPILIKRDRSQPV